MQQIKIFKTVENELVPMEKEINHWIKESGARVISITGNIAPQASEPSSGGGLSSFSASDVLIIVLYEK